jgi:hypothetical protein
MLTHHFDIVAAVALWPFRDVVEFLHHADHVPSIGATLAFSSHVDLTWTCHQACHAAQLAPIYAGMTVRGEREVGVEPRRDAGSPLRIATCGPLAKYRGAASHRWTDYAVAALAARDASLVHIGPVDDDFRAEIAQTLTAAGIDPARYSYTGAVPDLPAALIAERANLYLSSYPVSGGKANLEAMALGLPTVVPVDEGSPPLLQFDFPAATWTRISSPEALRSALQDRSPRDLADAESRAVMSEELARFERQVLDPPRPGSTSD